MIGMALVAVMLSFTMSSCDNDDDEVDPYKDYPQLIVGKWFNFTPEASMFAVYNADGTYSQVGYDSETLGWIDFEGTYSIEDTKNLRKNGRMRAKCDKWLVLIPFLCYPAIFIISAEIAVYGGY